MQFVQTDFNKKYLNYNIKAVLKDLKIFIQQKGCKKNKVELIALVIFSQET